MLFTLCVLYVFLLQYLSKWRNESINSLIEEAILKADKNGIKVLSLGLFNQASYILLSNKTIGLFLIIEKTDLRNS